jgi:hypothetical protein
LIIPDFIDENLPDFPEIGNKKFKVFVNHVVKLTGEYIWHNQSVPWLKEEKPQRAHPSAQHLVLLDSIWDR